MEPWDFKTHDERRHDTQRLFIIFCEDGSVEPAYFETFKKEGVKLSIFGNMKQHHAQIDSATEFCRKNDLLEVNKSGKEILKLDEGCQVWCVFDRDKEPEDGKDSAFNDSITTAKQKGIRTAWSNDDFELWILLHFADIDPGDTAYLTRKKYYQQLTSILKTAYKDEVKFQNPKFDYYSTMKSKKKFLQFTYELMKENLGAAIKRAEALDIFHNKEPKPTHLHCPCAKVYRLVQELTR